MESIIRHSLEIFQRYFESLKIQTIIDSVDNYLSLPPISVGLGHTAAAEIESSCDLNGYLVFDLRAASVCHVRLDKKSSMAEYVRLVNDAIPEGFDVDYDDIYGCRIYHYRFIIENESLLNKAAIFGHVVFFFQLLAECEKSLLSIFQVEDKVA